jgi:hypothetical protein
VSYFEALIALPGLTHAVFNARDSNGDGEISLAEAGSSGGTGGCSGCSGNKGAFTLERVKKALGNLFMGGLSLTTLLAFSKRRL